MSQPLRILFIGDSGADSVADELRRGGFDPSMESATTLEELIAALGTGCDIAISDFSSRHLGALEALKVIREEGIDLPLIVVSGEIGETEILAALKAGAADHLKRGSLMRLNAAVERETRAVRVRRDRARLEEQFRQAQKMEAVGRLAGGVAHDFNNLLTVITGYSDLLLAGSDLKEAHRAALEEIRRSSERGGQLTRQLLAFSRRQPLDLRVVRVNQLVMRMEEMLRRLIGEDIELVVVPAASQDAAEVDAGRLEQVIMNLVVNARDAMPGGGKLTIETTTFQLSESFSARQLGVQPGLHVSVSITDTGVGMDQETLSHAFEPFFTTKAPGRGTGLGLATAYGIIRQSGGAIAILSEPGKGTTARIYLPVKESPPETEAAEIAAPMSLAGDETILLVEDDARVRKLLAGLLKTRGYRILEAAGGEEAAELARLHRGPLHLALVDVVMPETSGPDLVRQIAPLHPEMRALYISGYTEEAMTQHGIPESSGAFLRKPFHPEVLARKVREVLDAPPAEA